MRGVADGNSAAPSLYKAVGEGLSSGPGPEDYGLRQ